MLGGMPKSTKQPRTRQLKFAIPIKLWVTQEAFDRVEKEAEKRQWTVPHMIRYLIDLWLNRQL